MAHVDFSRSMHRNYLAPSDANQAPKAGDVVNLIFNVKDVLIVSPC